MPNFSSSLWSAIVLSFDKLQPESTMKGHCKHCWSWANLYWRLVYTEWIKSSHCCRKDLFDFTSWHLLTIFILKLKGEITSACLELKGLLSLRDKYRSRVHLTLRAESTAMALSHWAYWVRTWPARVLYNGTVQRVQKM